MGPTCNEGYNLWAGSLAARLTTAMDPKEDSTAAFKVVCDSHGILPEDCSDYTVATIIDEEHGENCPASTKILPADDLEFQSARELAEEEEAVDDGSTSLEDYQDEANCPQCGDQPELFCCECGAESGGETA